MDEILLSIAIPTYNRCNFLMELVPEIIEQCIELGANHSGVEIIISDNASSDGTSDYILCNFSNSKLLKYYCNSKNVGGDANFIKSVERASGRYVWLFGDDELIEENGIANVLNILKKYSPSLVILNNPIDDKMNSRIYENYSKLLSAMSIKNPSFPMNHTLITKNIFLKSLFDINIANDSLSTNYGHMYALSENLKTGGNVYLLNKSIIVVRDKGGEFSEIPQHLLQKQAKYLRYLGKSYKNINIIIYSIFYVPLNIIKLVLRIPYKLSQGELEKAEIIKKIKDEFC